MIVPALVLGLWLLGYVVLWRIPICPRGRLPDERPTVSLIIPARNEEANLPALLKSLREQDAGPLDILVVDDDSTDRTAALAREHGARVLRSAPLPDGWRGKTWACHQGAGTAQGDLLLFVDADTFFEPAGFGRLVQAFLARPGVLSVCPFHRVPSVYEQLSAYFNLAMTAGIGAFSVFGDRVKRAGLFGQVLLVGRDAYHRVGGHEAVRGEILENLCLASAFREAGIPMTCLGGRGVVTMRMYPGGLKELVGGWSKAFATGAGKTPPWLLTAVIAWITGAILAVLFPLLTLLVRGVYPGWIWAVIYLVYAAQLHGMLRRIGSFHVLTALLFPLPLCFYLVVFMRSMFSRQVTWKGRVIGGSQEGRA